MPIRIATAPVSWGVMEVEGWARKQSYGEVLDEMVQAGYTGTELGPYGFLPTDSEELKRELGKRHMALLGAFVPLPLGRPQQHDEGLRSALEIARLLAANGAPFLVLAGAAAGFSRRSLSSCAMRSEAWRRRSLAWRSCSLIASASTAAFSRYSSTSSTL